MSKSGFEKLVENDCNFFTYTSNNLMIELKYIRSLAPWGVAISTSVGLLVLSRKEN